MRRQLLHRSASAVVVAGILCIGGTVAYFSSFDQEQNRVAVGRDTTEIEEDFPEPLDPGDKEKPEYKKKVWIVNTSSAEKGFNVDCYVRTAISYSNYDIGKAVTLLGLDTVNWIYNSDDGYYYYRKVLKEGETTVPLLTGFQIDRNKIDTLYLDTIDDFQINIYEESVGAADFTDYQSAWNYYLNAIQDT